jgi:hypothetical protein
MRATWIGSEWAGASAFSRPAGLRVVGVGVVLLGLTGPAEVQVDLQGTAVHPDAPDSAWESLWSDTLNAVAQLSRPVWVGAAAWLRWVLSSVNAPAPGTLRFSAAAPPMPSQCSGPAPCPIHAAVSGEAE